MNPMEKLLSSRPGPGFSGRSRPMFVTDQWFRVFGLHCGGTFQVRYTPQILTLPLTTPLFSALLVASPCHLNKSHVTVTAHYNPFRHRLPSALYPLVFIRQCALNLVSPCRPLGFIRSDASWL